MQFLPSTWTRYGADAESDGRADPQDVDDAALAAGRYLCAAAHGSLTSPAAIVRAVYTYNHSAEYVRLVLTLRAGYAGTSPASLGTGLLPPEPAGAEEVTTAPPAPGPTGAPQTTGGATPSGSATTSPPHAGTPHPVEPQREPVPGPTADTVSEPTPSPEPSPAAAEVSPLPSEDPSPTAASSETPAPQEPASPVQG